MAQSNPPIVDIRKYLIDNGAGVDGVVNPWSIFMGSEPDLPDSCITLYDIPAPPSNPKFLLDEPRFQVRVRAHNYGDAHNRAELIKGTILGLPNVTINDTLYVGIWVTVETSFLKLDDKNRSIIVTSYRCIREPNTGKHRVPL